jgi:predicted dehydrogenase
MLYAPLPKPVPVVKPGEFIFAASHLEHGHVYGQCDGLIEAGGELRYVYDTNPERLAGFCKKYPSAKPVDSFDRLLDIDEIKLVTSAGVPNERGPIGCRVMEAGKDYFVDKAPFTSLAQLEDARKVVAATGRIYAVFYCERTYSESAIFAGQLIEQGAIGRVLQVAGFGPHRLNAPSRPAWFFERAKYGGILCDIGSHQAEQILFYTGATDAKVAHAAVANYNSKAYPELEDFGEASLITNNGASGYFRIDWFTPDGLGTWGDGRVLILGTKGYIELRKVLDLTHDKEGEHVFLVDEKDQHHFAVKGKVGHPYFGQLILDCLNRTETAMTQSHTFKAAEVSLRCQEAAIRLE